MKSSQHCGIQSAFYTFPEEYYLGTKNNRKTPVNKTKISKQKTILSQVRISYMGRAVA
jgi:hypothetical protein